MANNRPLAVDPIAEAKRQWLAHGWTDAAAGMTAVTSLMRAQQLMLARVEAALKPFDLSFARYEMLRLLAFTREGRMPMASATARLQVHPTSVTNTVDRLAKAGLLRRLPHPIDGRAAVLELTDPGRDLVDEATVALNAVFENIGLDDADVTELVSIVARLRKSAGDFRDPAPVPDPL
ncbi:MULTISPECIES: MarR family winged helix-turn-helix transcriptional regulator [Microbacterium]|uniref:MarR family winged helix-turn-helix transcriptional regulator n=1 Tax=Microbacterium TaxID=33882 RepID=UPI001E60840B|nr:MarR family transcriptional regulator [Microbacterium nymphoidis]MCD2497981.1 MarR family transcriptional regulator [Microbacterium nymphoidis]